MGRGVSRVIYGEPVRGTTIVAVRRNGKLAMGGDGQVSIGETIVKATARKVQRIYKGRVLAGFSGAAADAFALLERFEGKLEETSGSLARAAYSLARDWRTDRLLRRLEAMLVVGDKEELFLISGTGDVIRPEDEICATGSGGAYAAAAARALAKHTNLSAEEIVREALHIAAAICVYTNDEIYVEVL